MKGSSADLEIIVTTPWGDGAPYLEFKLHSTNPDVDLHYPTFRGEQLDQPKNFQKDLLERLENLGLRLSADGEPRLRWQL
ncbi:MAG: hypothetical protein GY856_31465 [bacterium]|nr:hypothetical protein [bacterium]